MKWTIPKVMTAGFGLATVVLGVVSGVGYVNTHDLIRDIRMVGRTHEVSAQIETVFGLVKDMQAGGRGYALTGEEAFLEPYRTAVKEVSSELEQLRMLVAAKPEQLRRFDALASLVKQEMVFVEDLVQLRKTGGIAAAVDRVKSRQGEEVMGTLRNVVKEMQSAEDDLLRRRELYARTSAQHTLLVLLGGSGLAVLIVGVATVVIYRDSRARDALERAILEISEREQERIGRDLHDGLCQQLTGIGLLSQAVRKRLQPSNAREAEDISKVEELTDKALTSARGIARGLCPVEVEANGLMSALEELATAVGKTSGKQCRFDCPDPVFIEDTTVATHLYRIAQEAAHNAIRHAQAGRIMIELGLVNGQLSLEIRDDGKGFGMSSRNERGLGLDMMRHRARTIGGSLEIHSQPAGGTVVKCALPFRRAAEETPRNASHRENC